MKELIEKLEKLKDLIQIENEVDVDSSVEIIDQAIQALSQSEWISVEDRLPNTNCDVLVVKNNGKIVQMSFHAPFDSGKRVFQYWNFGKWIDQNHQVTYWIPLPQPPQTK